MGTQASKHVSSSKGDLKTYELFRSKDIQAIFSSVEDTALKTEADCRMAMIFVALLAGGDYVPEGIQGIGTATCLIRETRR
jgi:Holliday junction resolvase YEN1